RASPARVGVVTGHTESVAVSLDSAPSLDEIRHAFVSFSGAPQRHRLPSAPASPIVYLTEENRPQPRLDVDRDGGMAVTIGRLRPCPILGYKFFVLGHNTVRGAAGAAVLNAELLVAEGVLASPAGGGGDVRVRKFGGTSVADADAVRRVVAIVASERRRTVIAGPVVVVSALGGVT